MVFYLLHPPIFRDRRTLQIGRELNKWSYQMTLSRLTVGFNPKYLYPVQPV